jgi:hypothetical protein
MTEHDENTAAILQRLEKIEELLERMDRENRAEEARKAAFDVRWDQLMKEHTKMQEHVKENWERLNYLEKAPLEGKARLWDTFIGRAVMLIGTAIGGAVLTQIPVILKMFLEAK